MKINFNAPFWKILKGIGCVLGIVGSAALFYAVYILIWFAMEG
ncbi:MAG: hypothetical protein PUG50_04210 [Eubacteriales bacterium]|nr:hypothetical protein [Fenollaria sp.]MDD7339761.1 hypothetical protein [Eubacteriales bacterium]MDY3106343.1 hypothetical protein [Fenollaria sp.]